MHNIGSAGTGKSFTVAAITKMMREKLKKAAPTAKAAFIIHGKKKTLNFEIFFNL